VIMDIRPIRDDADYKWALKEIEAYFDKPPAAGSPEVDRFDVLVALIKDYETRDKKLPAVDPVDVLHFAIESMGRTQAELAAILGSRVRASKILNRRQRLTLRMIRDISAAWHLPIEALTMVYDMYPKVRLKPARTAARNRKAG
jgi:HTH-type transcriptional regulator/antitoxin HigA